MCQLRGFEICLVPHFETKPTVKTKGVGQPPCEGLYKQTSTVYNTSKHHSSALCSLCGWVKNSCYYIAASLLITGIDGGIYTVTSVMQLYSVQYIARPLFFFYVGVGIRNKKNSLAYLQYNKNSV